MPGLPKAIPARDIFFPKYEAGVVLLDDCKPHGNCVDPPSDLFFPSPDSKSRTTVKGSVKVSESNAGHSSAKGKVVFSLLLTQFIRQVG